MNKENDNFRIIPYEIILEQTEINTYKKKISKNCLCGVRIKDPKRLIDLVLMKKSIYHHVWKITPAAVLVNLPFRIILEALNENSLYEVIKIKKNDE